MKLKNSSRHFSTKLKDLIDRPNLRNGYPYEFLNKMKPKEINVFMAELKEILKKEDILVNKNINYYNKIFKTFLIEREEIYQLFKEIGVQHYF